MAQSGFGLHSVVKINTFLYPDYAMTELILVFTETECENKL